MSRIASVLKTLFTASRDARALRSRFFRIKRTTILAFEHTNLGLGERERGMNTTLEGLKLKSPQHFWRHNLLEISGKLGEEISMEEIAVEAINHALRALRKRHLLEEAAHLPALTALSRPIIHQGSEWKEKAENLEIELQQCYKAQSRLSEQLVVEVAESRALKAQVQEKEAMITDLQNELNQARDECSSLTALLEEKTKALELMISEHQDLKAELDEMTEKANKAESENKMLIDRWMLQKMQDAERLNEANSIYEEMLDRLKASGIEQLARQQVDGVVRRSEDGAEYYMESTIPSSCKQRITAHEGGCASTIFEYNSSKLISGGQDHTIKMWDTNSGSLSNTLHGCLGSVLDLSITHDNRSIIAASSSNNLYVWDVGTGRIRHTLTGHKDKVCAVDVGKFSTRHVASAAYDRTIKVWDLMKGYCANTILFHSNCNSLCFSLDGQTVCSGHVDGNLRLWDFQTGKLLSEVAAHSQAVTSMSLSRNGNVILTSGRDNLHNLFDIRTLEICGTFRANGNRIASNWSRSCISADDSYVAAGSADGSVHIWSILNGKIVSTLKEHTAPVLCCSWSGLGKPLATADKSGIVCIWS
nr:autophagy-related protein 16 [Ipomoea batatas]